jgi:hypothetical protein
MSALKIATNTCWSVMGGEKVYGSKLLQTEVKHGNSGKVCSSWYYNVQHSQADSSTQQYPWCMLLLSHVLCLHVPSG